MYDIETIKSRNPVLNVVSADLGDPVKKSGAWAHWFCPFHGESKSPSFAVNTSTNTWRCFGACAEGGDVIKFVMKRENVDFRRACEILSHGQPVQEPTQPSPKPALPDPYPSLAWGKRAAEFVQQSAAELYAPAGAKALAYLTGTGPNGRHLQPVTLERYHIGFNPEDRWDEPEAWGLEAGSKVWLPRGIVIPYVWSGRVWAINIRRPAGDPKYIKVRGSKPAVFGYENLRGAVMTVMTEGEFDCLLLDQEAGDLAGVGSFGSASNRLGFDLSIWGKYLYPIRYLLLAADTDLAGLKCVAGLEAITRRARRASLPAGGKDLTDCKRAGVDLAAWLCRTAETLGIMEAI